MLDLYCYYSYLYIITLRETQTKTTMIYDNTYDLEKLDDAPQNIKDAFFYADQKMRYWEMHEEAKGMVRIDGEYEEVDRGQLQLHPSVHYNWKKSQIEIRVRWFDDNGENNIETLIDCNKKQAYVMIQDTDNQECIDIMTKITRGALKKL